MLDQIKMWILSILVGAFILNIVDMILPKSKLKPFIDVVMNFIFVFIVITPVVNFFSSGINLEDKILKSMGEYNIKYVDSINDLTDKTGNNSLARGYEDGLKQVLQLKLDEYGYELEDLDIDGSDINNIKIKEKNNSNKSEKEDIQSKESTDEKSEQVFKDKEQAKHELNLSEKKLKEDLVKILDVSIDTIEID
ncbi:MAG: stage III sporulation protein AF [Romboutsia sp.]